MIYQENDKVYDHTSLSHSMSEMSIEDSVSRLSKPRVRATSEPLTSESLTSEPCDSTENRFLFIYS